MNPKEADEVAENTTPDEGGQDTWEIRVRGRLDARWAAWFEGMRLDHDPDGTTVLRGTVTDQAALHGMLQRIRDLGLELVSMVRHGPERGARPR